MADTKQCSPARTLLGCHGATLNLPCHLYHNGRPLLTIIGLVLTYRHTHRACGQTGLGKTHASALFWVVTLAKSSRFPRAHTESWHRLSSRLLLPHYYQHIFNSLSLQYNGNTLASFFIYNNKARTIKSGIFLLLFLGCCNQNELCYLISGKNSSDCWGLVLLESSLQLCERYHGSRGQF